MTRVYRKMPFSFAEIVVGAPWAMSVLAPTYDHDTGNMLHRNNKNDECSGPADPADIVALEHKARALRAETLREGFARLAKRLVAVYP